MDCIEQIWKLALGDNSPLANAAKSAADELDALRAQLAEAQEQISEFQQANADIHLWRTGYRRQLAEAQAEIARLKLWEESAIQACAKVESCYVSDAPYKTLEQLESWWFSAGMEEHQTAIETSLIVELRQQLAACRADNERLRDALFDASGEDAAYSWKVAHKALALPNDTTALNKLLAGVYEECAVHVGRAMFRSSYVTPEQLAEELRALAKQKGVA